MYVSFPAKYGDHNTLFGQIEPTTVSPNQCVTLQLYEMHSRKDGQIVFFFPPPFFFFFLTKHESIKLTSASSARSRSKPILVRKKESINI